MKQQVDMTVRLIFWADANLTRAQLASQIENEICRLLDRDEGSRVELTAYELGDVREEAEIYAST